jgi:hypothetical protein
MNQRTFSSFDLHLKKERLKFQIIFIKLNSSLFKGSGGERGANYKLEGAKKKIQLFLLKL